MRNPYDLIGRLGLLLAIAGAVNWLLVGLFEWNLVQWLFTQSGTQTVDNLGERIVYIVVGVGGVLALPMLAATLARSRSRDVSSEERGRSTAGLSEDDTDFYYGAPKNERELAREPRARAQDRAGDRRGADAGDVRRGDRLGRRQRVPEPGGEPPLRHRRGDRRRPRRRLRRAAPGGVMKRGAGGRWSPAP